MKIKKGTVPIFIAMTLLFVTSAYADITNGLVGHWAFDEGSGSTAADSSPSGKDAAIVTGTSAPQWVSGKMGGALYFDGIDDRVNVLSVPAAIYGFTSEDFSVSAWINPNDSTKALDIVSHGSNSQDGWELFKNGQKISFRTYQSNATQQTSSVNVTLNTWTHVVLVRHGSSASIYLNGQPSNVASADHLNPAASPSRFLMIGASSAGWYWSGLIDDVRIYNRALQPSEITSLYCLGEPTASVCSTSISVNQAPVVSAGSHQTITLPANVMTLFGTAFDPDNGPQPLSIAWSVVSGGPVHLNHWATKKKGDAYFKLYEKQLR